jgi:hypothetical protein
MRLANTINKLIRHYITPNEKLSRGNNMSVAMIGPKFYAWDRNGKPLAFGKLYTYQARTNTPKDTYQSEDQIVANTNPVILNGEGYANVYLDGAYKMVLKDKDENEIWSSDPVSSNSPSEWTLCLAATYVSTTILKVAGNFTDQYEVGQKVRINNNAPEYAYSSVKSLFYAATETTIELTESVITTGVNEICKSIVGPKSAVAHNFLGGVNDPGGHEIIHRRNTTVAVVESGVFVPTVEKPVLLLTITDRGDAKFNVISGGTPNGSSILDAGNGNTAVLQGDETKSSAVNDIDEALTRGVVTVIDTDEAISTSIIIDGSKQVGQKLGKTLNVAANTAAITLQNSSAGLFEGITMVGDAALSDTAPSMFLNTQVAGVANVSNTTYRVLNLSKMTLGLNLTQTENQKVLDSTFENMELSSTAQGGYGVLQQGAKKTIVSGSTFISGTNPRHAVYTSRIVTDPVGTGNSTDTLIVNNIADYSLAPNDLGGRVPYVARSVDRIIYNALISNGGKGFVNLVTENGAAKDVIINSDISTGVTATGTTFLANIAIGEGGLGVNRFVIANGISENSLSVDGAGGRDQGVRLETATNGIISNRVISTQTASALYISNCSKLIIDNIVDEVTGVNIQPVILFNGVNSKITIGNILHNRADIAGKSALFDGLDTVTDMTCRFARSTRIVISGGLVSASGLWSLVSTVTMDATAVTITWKSHVTQDAAELATPSIISGAAVTIKKTSNLSKTCVIQIFNAAGSVINPTTYTGTLSVNIFS